MDVENELSRKRNENQVNNFTQSLEETNSRSHRVRTLSKGYRSGMSYRQKNEVVDLPRLNRLITHSQIEI